MRSLRVAAAAATMDLPPREIHAHQAARAGCRLVRHTVAVVKGRRRLRAERHLALVHAWAALAVTGRAGMAMLTLALVLFRLGMHPVGVVVASLAAMAAAAAVEDFMEVVVVVKIMV